MIHSSVPSIVFTQHYLKIHLFGALPQFWRSVTMNMSFLCRIVALVTLSGFLGSHATLISWEEISEPASYQPNQLANQARCVMTGQNQCVQPPGEYYCPSCWGGGITWANQQYYCIPPFVLFERHSCLPPNDQRVMQCQSCGCCQIGGIVGAGTGCSGLDCFNKRSQNSLMYVQPNLAVQNPPVNYQPRRRFLYSMSRFGTAVTHQTRVGARSLNKNRNHGARRPNKHN